MMKNKKQVDGFVRRRVGGQFGEYHEDKTREAVFASTKAQELHSGENLSRPIAAYSGRSLSRSDIDDSLRLINELPVDSHKLQIEKNPRRLKVKKMVISIITILLLVGLVTGGYVTYKFLNAGGKVFNGSLIDLLRSEPLLQDANGRSNFLIFGTAEDDENGMHDGKYLTDSIMILSVDQANKNAYMVSVPRDLWVKYDSACSMGYMGKINSVYECASNDGVDDKAGASALMSKVKETTGMDMQYYVHINFTVVKDAVNAVGGVQIVIESSDPRGIFDDNFDWKCNYKCHMVKYPNGLTPVLDGEHALALARARGASGNTYGLPNANFDREKNQQKILKALFEKALSVGTLSNLGKVTSLLDALGNNLRTNIESKYIRTIMALGTSIKSDNFKAVSLIDPNDPVVTTSMIGDASVVVPISGTYDYSSISNYLAKKVTSDPILMESASIAVYNGSGVAGKAAAAATDLESQNYNVTTVSTASDTINEPYQIYQLDNSMTKTAAALASKYSVKILKTQPPFSVPAGTAFVIIIGPSTTTSSSGQ